MRDGSNVYEPEGGSPKRMRKKQAMYPARLFAHRVMAITPLFCEKVVLGGVIINPPRSEASPSASSPPWTRPSKRAPRV